VLKDGTAWRSTPKARKPREKPKSEEGSVKKGSEGEKQGPQKKQKGDSKGK
jgi:hypothetical protein